MTHIVANERSNERQQRTETCAPHICSFNVFTNEYLDILFAFYGQFVANRDDFHVNTRTRYATLVLALFIACLHSQCEKYYFFLLSLSLPASMAYARQTLLLRIEEKVEFVLFGCVNGPHRPDE